jgi:hypothetical protein
MRMPDLDKLLLEALSEDHPEIVNVEQPPNAVKDPTYATRVKVTYASGAASYVMVHHVAGPGVPSHAAYELPTGV